MPTNPNRHALLIGNSAYPGRGRLRNPQNDVVMMAQALRRSGYRVTTKKDLTGSQMRRELTTFARRSKNDEASVVFFSGHGNEIRGKTLLAGIDSRGIGVKQIWQELERYRRREDRVNVVIVDACRNGLASSGGRSSESTRFRNYSFEGNEPDNIYLIQATRSGTTASDGRHETSPFVEAFAPHICVPGLNLHQAHERAVKQMKRQGRQTPTYYKTATGSFQFVPQLN